MTSDLMNRVHPDDAPDNALSGRQLHALKDGVRAAIEDTEDQLGAPGRLTNKRWSHAGVGISVYMHPSGVVVLTSSQDDGVIVTDSNTLDGMDTARAVFHVDPGTATVSTKTAERDAEQPSD